jgi:antitoxin component of MazEF toxin-antitoxin module
MLLGVSATRADEVKVELKDLPKAVLETVKKRFPKAELIEAAKETDGTKVEFEVTLKVGETKYDVMLTPDGKITLIEKTIALKDLPKAVAEAVEKAYPKATLTLAEEMTKIVEGKEVLSYYEVQLTTADKKMLEVEVSPEGKILMTEDKSKEKK